MVEFTARLACVILCVATVLPLLPSGAWMIRLCDFPRIQLLVLAALLILATPFAFSKLRDVTPITILFLSVLCLIWQAAHVVPYTPLATKRLPDHHGDDSRVIRTAVVNLQYENPQKPAVSEQLEKLETDLILLVEVDEAWQSALGGIYEKFPHHLGVVLEKGHGLQLISRLPLADGQVRYLVDDSRPSLWCVFEHEGEKINYVGLHPTPPGLPVQRDELAMTAEKALNRHDSRIRDAELMIVAKEVSQTEGDGEHWIVAGDFNDVAWSHTTRLFRRMSGLEDPRIGRGLYNSYHAKYPLLRFPIDQIWLSRDASVASMGRFQPVGSDHFAITTSVFFPPAGGQVFPEPEGNDHSDASKLIEQGLEDAATHSPED